MKTAKELLELFEKNNLDDLRTDEEHLALNWFVFLSCPDPDKYQKELLQVAHDISSICQSVSNKKWLKIAKRAVEMCQLKNIDVTIDNVSWLMNYLGWDEPTKPIAQKGVH